MTIYAIDYLFGARYPEIVLQNHPTGWGAGFFGDRQTVGADVFPLVQQLAKRGDVPVIRIHLKWSDTHTFGAGDIRGCIADARRYESLHGHSRIELSPFCEHNIPRMVEKYYEPIAHAAPSCTIINTPWQGTKTSKYRLELHGSHIVGKFNQYSYDGCDAFTAQPGEAKQFAKNLRCDVCFLWTPLLNMKTSLTDKTPRAQRTARPTKETIQKLVKLVS